MPTANGRSGACTNSDTECRRITRKRCAGTDSAPNKGARWASGSSETCTRADRECRRTPLPPMHGSALPRRGVTITPRPIVPSAPKVGSFAPAAGQFLLRRQYTPSFCMAYQLSMHQAARFFPSLTAECQSALMATRKSFGPPNSWSPVPITMNGEVVSTTVESRGQGRTDSQVNGTNSLTWLHASSRGGERRRPRRPGVVSWCLRPALYRPPAAEIPAAAASGPAASFGAEVSLAAACPHRANPTPSARNAGE